MAIRLPDILDAADAELEIGFQDLTKRILGTYERSYADVSRELDGLRAKIAAAPEIATITGSGTVQRGIPPSWILQQDRYTRLQSELRGLVVELSDEVGQAVPAAQRKAYELGLVSAESLVGPVDPRVVPQSYASVPNDAIRRFLAYSSSDPDRLGGSPLAGLLDTFRTEVGDSAAQYARDVLVNGLGRGRALRSVAAELEQGIRGMTASRALTIARTETLRAHREAHFQSYKANAALVRSWIWTAAVANAERPPCAACFAQHGTEHPIDERMETHPNAVLAGSSFVPYGRLLEMVGAKYDGPAIRLAAGSYSTTIGPNHPMLTARGFVRARDLAEGDELVYDLRRPSSGEALEADLDNAPFVEEAFEAARAGGADARIPASRDDLHGDAVYVEDEIDVVWPDRYLLAIADAGIVQKVRELLLARTDAEPTLVSGASSRDERLGPIMHTASGRMSGGGSRSGDLVLLPIRAVETIRFQGRAFDASTESGLYCSDGFVVKNCRCRMIPKRKPFRGVEPTGPATKIRPGSDVFRDLSPRLQRRILGPARFRAYREGDLPFFRMASYSSGPWGRTLRVTPLRPLGLDRLGRPLLPGAPKAPAPTAPPAPVKIPREDLDAKIRGIEDEIVNRKYETAVAFDDAGKVLLDKRGVQFQVECTDAEVAAMRGATLIHNHPRAYVSGKLSTGRFVGGSSFSEQDVYFTGRNGIPRIRAVSHGWRHELEWSSSWKGTGPEIDDLRVAVRDATVAAKKDAEAEIRALAAATNRRRLEIAKTKPPDWIAQIARAEAGYKDRIIELEFESNHRVWERVASSTGFFRYSRESR